MNYKRQQTAAMIIGRTAGLSYADISKVFDVDATTVSRSIKRTNQEGLVNVFQKVTYGDEEHYELSTPYLKVISEGDLVVGDIEITGKDEDGVIKVNDIHVIDTLSYMSIRASMNDKYYEYVKHNMSDSYIHDIGVLGKLKVGHLLLTGDSQPSSSYDLKGNVIDFTVAAKEEVNGEIAQWCVMASSADTEQLKCSIEVDEEDFYNDVDSEEEPEEVEEPEEEYIWNASQKFITITVGRDTYNADSDHPSFKEALQSLVDGDIKRALELINIKRGITSYVEGNISIENETLYYKGLEIRSGLTTRIINSMLAGEEFKFYLPFLENLMENPSRKAVLRLFDFLVANDIEITEDGHFLAWKYVRKNFFDCHSGKYDNNVGQIPEMPRNQVDEDDERTCSEGLHVCAKSYLGNINGYNVVKCKVHPRDVVSIPVDYNDAKMRTCRYEVIEDVTHLFTNE